MRDITEPPVDQSPAEILRLAAARVREFGSGASPGPWHVPGIGDYGWAVVPMDLASSRFGVETEDSEQGRADAEWIALMHPGLREPLADVLEEAANAYDLAISFGATADAAALAVSHQLSLARVILGRPS